MELLEAIHKASQILDEERTSPTVKYSLRAEDLSSAVSDILGIVAVLKEPELLRSIRSKRPREVQENPTRWAFKSVNCNLLGALLSQLPGDSRPALLSSVLSRLSRPPGCGRSRSATEPPWNGLASEFPLIAEFCVRNGGKDNFIRVLGELQPFQGHAVLLRHLEDMIALNFSVFSEKDYELLTTAITTFGYTARRGYQAHKDSGARGADASELSNFWKELIDAAAGIKEECRKARYLYLKGALLEGFNLEVNQDKTTVEHYLKAQGFSDTLIECLNRADQAYQGASSGFEFKSCMGHLRSFLEKLHLEGIEKLQLPALTSPDKAWGKGLKSLQENSVISRPEEAYAVALYRLVSDEGVHPVIAEREYARLARNVIIEYALLFLRILDKRRSR